MWQLPAETAKLRVTLTSRPDQYRATLAAGWQLPHTAVIELHPVSPRAAARFLLDSQIGSARQGWQQVTDRLQSEPDGVLARTLNTPLTLSLARSAYGSGDPTELLSPHLTSEQSLRGHLLDQVLFTAYPDQRERAHASYWLGWIANQMNTHSAGATRDLRWWDIASWAYTWHRQLLGALLGGIAAVPGIILLLFGGPESAILMAVGYLLAIFGGLVSGLLLALVVGHSGGIARSSARLRTGQPRSQQKSHRIRRGLVFGLAAGLSAGCVSVLWVLLLSWQESAEGDWPWEFLIDALFLGLSKRQC